MSKNWTQTASVFSVGLGVGALRGLIFAPQSGARTREYLRDKAQSGVDDAVERSKKVGQRAKRVAGEAKDLVDSALDAGESAFRHARNT
jgi:gas vesicle protein